MMRFLHLHWLSVIAAIAASLAAGTCAASHPDILRSYRFIPSRSTLVVNGSSTGSFEETFHASGTFGIVTGFRDGFSCTAIGCPPSPTHVPYAQFVNVESWLIPDSPLTYVLDLDETLNLSGLEGTFGNVGPNRLYFKGDDGKGRPFHLEATIRGPLVRLVGESGPGCCNVDHYLFDALAYLWPHPDFNLDGTVDAADYVVWRKSLDQALADLDAPGGDNGAAALGDFGLWRANFGTVTDFNAFADAAMGSDAATGPGAVPEPATVGQFLLAILMLTMYVGRRAGRMTAAGA
jgi:hypothetical protein